MICDSLRPDGRKGRVHNSIQPIPSYSLNRGSSPGGYPVAALDGVAKQSRLVVEYMTEDRGSSCACRPGSHSTYSIEPTRVHCQLEGHHRLSAPECFANDGASARVDQLPPRGSNRCRHGRILRYTAALSCCTRVTCDMK